MGGFQCVNAASTKKVSSDADSNPREFLVRAEPPELFSEIDVERHAVSAKNNNTLRRVNVRPFLVFSTTIFVFPLPV
jgi:hypothetical protein